MKMYSRICHIVEHDRKYVYVNPLAQAVNLNSFSFLDQKGPKTLNNVMKKSVIKDIESENQKIKEKIDKAKSNYSLRALSNHKQKLKQHKHILMANSPSKGKLVDPLVRKIDNQGDSLKSLVSQAKLTSLPNCNQTDSCEVLFML